MEHISTRGEVVCIQAAGGTVWVGCLGGMLQVTRGLGDLEFEVEGFSCSEDVVLVLCRAVDFVLLASHGLWDVLDDVACCRLVRECGAEADSAGRLGGHASSLGSLDHLSVIVVRFSAAEQPA